MPYMVRWVHRSLRFGMLGYCSETKTEKLCLLLSFAEVLEWLVHEHSLTFPGSARRRAVHNVRELASLALVVLHERTRNAVH
eukprot:2176081-Amphidinium_carterae.1